MLPWFKAERILEEFSSELKARVSGFWINSVRPKRDLLLFEDPEGHRIGLYKERPLTAFAELIEEHLDTLGL